MRKWFVLLLSIMFLLASCGQKYDKEINEVSKLEKESIEHNKTSNDRDFKRKTSNFNVYEDGNVITVTYKVFKDSDTEFTSLYKLNKSDNKYEEDLNAYPKKYMKNHEPDYKEENMNK